MLPLNQHIEQIINRAVKVSQHQYDIIVDKRAVVIRVPRQLGEVKVTRFITVGAQTDRDTFTVRFQEIAEQPAFTTQRREQEFSSMSEDQIDWACRVVYAYIEEKVKPELIPEVELVTRMEEINMRWMGDNATLQLYLQGSEFGDDWRYRITDKDGNVICESLDPATADGHNYIMLVRTYNKGYRKGQVDGICRNAESLAMHTFHTAFNRSGVAQHEIPDCVRNTMRHGFLGKLA